MSDEYNEDGLPEGNGFAPAACIAFTSLVMIVGGGYLGYRIFKDDLARMKNEILWKCGNFQRNIGGITQQEIAADTISYEDAMASFLQAKQKSGYTLDA